MARPPLQPCGTQAAYQRHTRKGERPCDPCRAAHTAYLGRWLSPDWQPRELMPCGTEAAARRHWRRGEPLDEACRQASRVAQRERHGCDPWDNGHGGDTPDFREIRNGIPWKPYVYRGLGYDVLEPEEDVAS